MLNALTVVLRETLEASLLICLIYIYTTQANIKRAWLLSSLPFAVILSFIIATNMISISDWLDGVGQEFLYASMLFQVGFCLLLLNLFLFVRYVSAKQTNLTWPIIALVHLCLISALSIEGSEIIIYFQSSQQLNGMYSASVGGLLGAGIGLSLGIVAFYSINYFKVTRIHIVQLLMIMTSAGMFSQTVAYLSQAGIFDSGLPLWDSSSLLEESSLVGQLLYALFSYEATPTLYQVIAVALTLLISLFSLATIYYFKRTDGGQHAHR